MARALYWVALAIVILLGAYLRLVDLDGPSLWHDEIVHLRSAELVAQHPWYRNLLGVEDVRGWTENGFLYYSLQNLGQKLVPGEVGVRLMPAVLGFLALPLMALCGRLCGGRLLSLTSTTLLAVAPLHVYFSREGRPYSLLMFLALLLLCALLWKGARPGVVLAWIGCLGAALTGIHSGPILLAFLTVSVWVWFLDPDQRSSGVRSPYLSYLTAATLSLGLLYALYMSRSDLNKPELDRFQGSSGGPSQEVSQMESPVYLSPISRLALERFLASMTTSGHQSVLTVRRSWLLLGLSLAGLIAGLRRRPLEAMAIAGMFLLPALLSIFALVALDRWYGLRYTASALSAFVLLVAWGMIAIARLAASLSGRYLRIRHPSVVEWAVAVVVLILLAGPNVLASRADPYRKLDWRGVAAFFDRIALDNEPILMGNTWPEICLGFYLRQLGRDAEFVNLWESATTGQAIVDETPQGWLLTAGFRKTNEVRGWMHDFHPVFKRPEEEMALFFFPDFVTLFETRFAAGRAELFETEFERWNRRFDFEGAEWLLQGRGWSYPERNSAGVGYQWATGRQAELGLAVRDRSLDYRLRFRLLPFTYPDAPPQSLELWLNQERLAELEISEGWSEHEVPIPASLWGDGTHVLELRFAHSAAPAQVGTGSTDERVLSAAFDFLELVPSSHRPDS